MLVSRITANICRYLHQVILMLLCLFLFVPTVLGQIRADDQYWHDLGVDDSGMNKRVYILSEYNNQLIAGGEFSSAGNSNAMFISSWSGSGWKPLGLGVNDWVIALTEYNSELIVGGAFTIAGGESANHVASADERLVFISSFAAGDKGAIHAYQLDLASGQLKQTHKTTDVEYPFFLAISPNNRCSRKSTG